METDRDALRAPVREEGLHVVVDVRGADDQLGAVTDLLLTLVRRDQVVLLHRRAEGDVADGVVVIRGRIRFPHLDARLHQLAHRRLEVIVADDAAGYPRRARTRRALVENDDVRARPEPARPQLLGEVIGGREAVDAGPDDDVRRCSRRGHFIALTATLSPVGTWSDFSAPARCSS